MQKNKNINFVLVGAKATGKTVYLASLYLKTKFITSKNAKTTAYLKGLADTLLEGKYPNATSGSLYDLLFDYKNEDFNCTIRLDDVDGHFIETLSQKDETTQRERDKLINTLGSSEGVIFFFPYETETYEKSKEFNYQIDTVISTLKEIYDDRDGIPIPATILVTKWDMSSDYKSKNEEQKAMEYIENHEFFKLAKEKIEQNFDTSKIIPISAIGSDINNLEPYNLEKPIEFFLTEIYSIWVHKLNKLSDKPEEQLILLSKIYTDIQFYKNGKYKKLYSSLEEEYAKILLQRVKFLKNLKEFKLFEDENSKIIDALTLENRDKIKKFKKKLEQKKYLKAIPLIAVAGLVFTLYSNQQITKNESELFESIKVEYANHNYKKTLLSINEYQDKYREDIEHKNEIIEIKNLIKKEEILLQAQRIIEDKTLQSVQSIDAIFSAFSELGIVEEESLSKELMNKKNKLLLQNSVNKLKDDVEKLDFEKSLLLMGESWKENYTNKELFIKILNKKFNLEIIQLIETISNINNMDEYNNLLEKLNQIKTLQKNSVLKKINYKATLSDSNKNSINQQIKLQAEYNQLLKNGVSGVIVSFGTDYAENEPLGFDCSSEYQIEMELNGHIYNYENRTNCLNITMIWNPSNTFFRKGSYFIKIVEVDLTDNDHYDNGSFSLTNNDLIQVYNKKYLKKDIGSGYFVGLKKQ